MYSIEVPLLFGHHKIVVEARAVKNLGGIGLVVGSQALEDIDAKLDFTSHTLRFNKSSLVLLLEPQISFLVSLVHKHLSNFLLVLHPFWLQIHSPDQSHCIGQSHLLLFVSLTSQMFICLWYHRILIPLLHQMYA